MSVIDRDILTPSGIKNIESVVGSVNEFYEKIEMIRKIENAYLDTLINDMETLTSKGVRNFVDAEEVAVGVVEVDGGDNSDEQEVPVLHFPDHVSYDKSALERWEDMLIDLVIKADCQLRSVKEKRHFSTSSLTDSLKRTWSEITDSPKKTQDNGFYASVKQYFFGD